MIVATHQDLAAKQSSGTFRRDLFYRLCTHQVRIPALRERKGDIPILVEHFLGEAARELDKKKPTAPRELPVLLSTYAFPGNVRELKAMTYDAVSLHRERTLSMETFVKAIDRGGGALPERSASAPGENPFLLVEPLLDPRRGRSSWLRRLSPARRATRQSPPVCSGSRSQRYRRDKRPHANRADPSSKGYEPAHVGEHGHGVQRSRGITARRAVGARRE